MGAGQVSAVPLLKVKQILDQHNEPDFTFSIGRHKRPWVGTQGEPEPGLRWGLYL